MPPDPATAAAKAAAVFEGRTFKAAHDSAGGLIYRFEVVRAWKGVSSDTVEIHTAPNSAACGTSYAPGEAYVIYAYAAADGTLHDGLCQRSRRTASAAEDLEVLGPGRTPSRSASPGPDVESPRIEPVPERSPQPIASNRGCTFGERPVGTNTAILMLLAVCGPRRRPALPVEETS